MSHTFPMLPMILMTATILFDKFSLGSGVIPRTKTCSKMLMHVEGVQVCINTHDKKDYMSY